MRYAKSVGTFAAGLSIAILATVGAGPAFAGPVTAGGTSGQIVFDYRTVSGTTLYNVQGLPGLPAPASLASQLSAQWGDLTAELCNTVIEPQAIQILNSNGGYTMKNWQCTVPTNGSLQLSQLSSTELQLSWQTQGISISFNINAFTSPKISGTFDADLNIDLDVGSGVTADDSSPTLSPLSLADESLSFGNANFTGSSLVPKSALQNTDGTVNSTTLDPSTLEAPPSFNQMVTSTNQFVHQVAAAVYNTYLGPGVSEYFDLDWAVNNNNLVLTLARDGSAPPAPPTGCSISAYALDFEATCNSQQPPGVSEITIMETHLGSMGDADNYENGNWTVVNANGQPYADINAWEFPSTDPTLYLAACSLNEWGSTCAAPTEFPNLNDPSSV
ncbi:MAG TPA: hypothetical protein VEJ84_08505, partial [Acidimicrobiales bacterium]|nr:hypothetical protein [Acidimicrobiales bacterium]